MPIFAYKAKDRAGNTRTGTLEANDERHAASMIREAGGLPMEIRPTREATTVLSAAQPVARPSVFSYLIDPLWTGVNIRNLIFFFRQMATLLNAGMSLSEALRSVGSRCGGRMRRIIMEAALHVQNGGQLSEVMARHRRIFGTLPISLVRAGEVAGLLTPMIERIAVNLEYEISIRRRLLKVIFYPCLVFFFVIITPYIPVLFNNGPREFGIALWFGISDYVPWVIGTIVAVKLIMQFEPCRLVWDYIKMLPPVLGTMARKVAMSRFCRAITDLYAAGMPVAEAVRVSADACSNVAVGRGIKRAVPALRQGEGLTASLTKTGAVMPIVLEMLSTGEKTGSLDGVLPKVADYMDEEVDATIYKSGIALFVLMMLIAAWMVLRFATGFYTGQVNDTIQRANQ